MKNRGHKNDKGFRECKKKPYKKPELYVQDTTLECIIACAEQGAKSTCEGS